MLKTVNRFPFGKLTFLRYIPHGYNNVPYDVSGLTGEMLFSWER